MVPKPNQVFDDNAIVRTKKYMNTRDFFLKTLDGSFDHAFVTALVPMRGGHQRI
jgi:hypothetical protein